MPLLSHSNRLKARTGSAKTPETELNGSLGQYGNGSQREEVEGGLACKVEPAGFERRVGLDVKGTDGQEEMAERRR